MRKSMQSTLCGVAVILVVAALASGSKPMQGDHGVQSATAKASVSTGYGKLPLYFEQNRGQTDPAVEYLSRGPGHTLYLTANEQLMQLRGAKQGEAASLRISLAGARTAPAMAGEQLREGKSHYFNRSPAITNVPHYGRVRYSEVYEGIDLVFYGNPQQLEYDFIVAPGSDPQDIRLSYQGAESARINDGGDLELALAGGTVVQKKPLVYQEVDGQRVEIESRYTQPAPMEVAFALGDYDQSRPLVIDPVLVYSTYLGGSFEDMGKAIAVDGDGSAYVTGSSATDDFPVQGGVQTARAGNFDVFITKLNPAGNALVYSTYLGGAGTDTAAGIAIDAVGNAYVTGYMTGTAFPSAGGCTTCNPAQGEGEAFVAKLSPAGDALLYSTLLGGSKQDLAFGIAVDGTGHAYVVGKTYSPDFPVAAAFQSVKGTRSGPVTYDAFITKLNPAGSALVYSTFLGGGADDDATAVTLDAAGNAYVVGMKSSDDFPLEGGLSGCTPQQFDGFIAKLNPAGSDLAYSTCFGAGVTFPTAVAVDDQGNAYVAGKTRAPDFPVVGGVQPGGLNTVGTGSNHDAFVSKFNPAGDALVYSTYLGGGGEDGAKGLAVDDEGNALITGDMGFNNSPNAQFPEVNGGTTQSCVGPDVFISKLNAAGDALAYSTCLGGSQDEYAGGVAVDSSGNAYLVGFTRSEDFPVMNAIQPEINDPFQNGFPDAFISKVSGSTGNPDPQNGPGQLRFVGMVNEIHPAGEGSYTYTDVKVVRVSGSQGAVSVVCSSVAGGSATPGADFQPVNVTLSWADGVTAAQSCPVVILADNIDEPAETVPLQLSNPTGGATVGTPSTTTVEIATGSGEPDTTPDGFSFTDQNGQATCVSVGVVVQSNTITVAGISAPAAISVVGGEYRIGNGAFTSAAGTVRNGDTVQLRHTSAATQGAATNTTLTIGGVSDTFTSSTCGAGTTTPGASCPANDPPIFETASQPVAEFDAELAYTLRVRSPTGGSVTVNVRGLPSCISLLSNGLDPNSYRLSGLVDVGCAAGSFDIQLRAFSESGCATDLLLPISLLNGEREVLTDFLGRLVRMVTNLGELEDVRSISAATQPVATLPGFSYPQGFFSGRIDDTASKASGASQAKLAVGGVANVSFSIGADGANAFVSCDARFCQELPLLSSSASALSVQLQDGGAGDMDGRADGIITFNGAPALKSAAAAVGRRSDGSSGGAFGAIWLLLLLCSLRLMHGTWAQRRRGVVA